MVMAGSVSARDLPKVRHPLTGELLECTRQTGGVRSCFGQLVKIADPSDDKAVCLDCGVTVTVSGLVAYLDSNGYPPSPVTGHATDARLVQGDGWVEINGERYYTAKTVAALAQEMVAEQVTIPVYPQVAVPSVEDAEPAGEVTTYGEYDPSDSHLPSYGSLEEEPVPVEATSRRRRIVE